uniref:Uncharacterized protein n=1 Tax=Triticum urartu TaxID=4572 RepID=A0A8R7R0W9_TRIUA
MDYYLIKQVCLLKFIYGAEIFLYYISLEVQDYYYQQN